MSFEPYDIYAQRLPVLKPGHFIKAAEKMHQIFVVRRNRQAIALSAALEATAIPLNTDTNENLQALHGALSVGRITHMQYLGMSADINTIFRWGTEPLGSKWVEINYDSIVAARDHPAEVDRWSHNKEMRLAYTKAIGALTVYFEMIEYEVKATALKPTRYLKILPNGQAAFIEAGIRELTLPKRKSKRA